MPLSEYEQRMLEQMERQLRSDDPKLANTLGSRRSRGSRVLVGSLVVLLGVGLLFAGALQSMMWLGVGGFLAMLGGVLFGLSKPRDAAKASGGPGKSARPGASRAGKRGFMDRLADRWDRRRDAR
jgi:hypothetical protein